MYNIICNCITECLAFCSEVGAVPSWTLWLHSIQTFPRLSVGFVVVYFIRDSIMIGGPPEGKSLNPAADFWPLNGLNGMCKVCQCEKGPLCIPKMTEMVI